MADIKTIDKLIPQYLNTDADERLVKSYEMVEALNIRVSHEDDGDSGVIKNVEGNEEVLGKTAADVIPAGTNKVIGSTSSEAGKCIYFFLYNSNGYHGIYRYGVTENAYQKIYGDSVLNFAESGFIKGDVVINQFGEHLLYFTDNRNEPRKINATKALNGGYSNDFYNGTAVTKELFLTVCKQPPQKPITFEFQTNESLGFNHLKEALFQFSYQYVYDDGEVSALAPYSEIAVSSTHISYNSVAKNYLDSFNNELKLKVTLTKAPVDNIYIYARLNNGGTFYKIGEIENEQYTLVNYKYFIFKNNQVYNALSSEEANKLYDAVPKKALAQAISNNRLFYGGYTEGFNDIVPDVYTYPVYSPRPITSSIEVDLTVPDTLTEDFSDDSLTSEMIRSRFALYGPNEGGLYASIARGYQGYNGFINNTTHYQNAETNGVGFLFDLSNSDGFQTSSGDLMSASVTLDCSRLAIAAYNGGYDGPNEPHQYNSANSPLAIPIEVATYDGAHNEIHSQTLYALNGNHPAGGSIMLVPSQPLFFSSEWIGSGTQTQEDLANEIIEGFNDTHCILPVDSGFMQEGVLHRFSAWLTPTLQNHSTSDQYAADWRNQMPVWFDGSITLEIFGGSYNSSDGTVHFKIRLVAIDVQADMAVAVTTLEFAPGSVNDFATNGDTAYETLIGTIIGGVYSSSSTYGEWFSGDKISCSLNTQVNTFDGTAIHDFVSGYLGVRTHYRDFELMNGTFDVVSLDGNGATETSFKAGASHDFGVVYFDHRNRTSSVLPITPVKSTEFGGEARYGNQGNTAIDMKLWHSPPSWAVTWAPVYAKNSSYASILQVVVSEAALGKKSTFVDIRAYKSDEGEENTVYVNKALKDGRQGEIYISLRGLEGKSNSYKEFKGSDLTYTYNIGDILRVLEYVDEYGNLKRVNHEFRITSYKYYNNDEENPILLSDEDESTSDGKEHAAYRRTGWWLTIRDISAEGFDRDAIALMKDYWSQKCLVEIYTPAKTTEDKLYYEVGKIYDITTVGGERTHGGDRSNTSSPVFPITFTNEAFFTTTQRLYLEDRVVTIASAQGYVDVKGIFPLEQGGYRYKVSSSTPLLFLPGLTSVVQGNTISNLVPGVITLTQGDVYLRVREQLRNALSDYTNQGIIYKYDPTLVNLQDYDKFTIESERANDFFDSKAVSIGRPFIVLDESREITRKSAVTYSGVYSSDSIKLNLSSFNPSLFPFKDYSSQHGGVSFLIDQNESLLVLQEKKIVVQPIGRTLIESAEGGQLVTSTEVLGKETYMSGSYGPGRNPESIVQRFGKVFFVDIEAGKVVAITAKGVSLISDVGMEAYFEYKFATLLENGSVIHIPCGIDPENNELIITTPGLAMNDISIDGSVIVTAEAPDNVSYDAMVLPEFTTNTISWNQEPSCWNYSNSVTLEPWEEMGQGVVYLDKINDYGFVKIDPEFATSASVNVAILDTADTFRGMAIINISLSALSLTSGYYNDISDCSAQVTATSAASTAVGTVETISYNTTYEKWMSMYSFVPELYGHIHNKFFSYKGGKMYRHNTNSTRNNFYGVQAVSKIKLISNQQPSSIKVYNALSLESNNKWSGVITNTNQTTNIPVGMLEEKEGLFYSVIPKDVTSDSTKNMSYKIVLGAVASVVDDVITFDSRISNLPFGLGDEVWKLEAATESDTTYTITDIPSRTSIQVSASVSDISEGDVLMAVSSNVINGDKIRDYYASIELSTATGDTGPIELYAVNMVYSPSNLHNESTGGVGTKQKKA